jgi:hypothetical protein
VSGPGPKLTITNDVHNVAVARAFVTSALAVLDVEPATCDKAKLVTSELVTQLVSNSSVDEIVVEIRPEPRPMVTIGSEVDLPELPADVRHILDSLTGVHVEPGSRAWTVTFEGP